MTRFWQRVITRGGSTGGLAVSAMFCGARLEARRWDWFAVFLATTLVYAGMVIYEMWRKE